MIKEADAFVFNSRSVRQAHRQKNFRGDNEKKKKLQKIPKGKRKKKTEK